MNEKRTENNILSIIKLWKTGSERLKEGHNDINQIIITYLETKSKIENKIKKLNSLYLLNNFSLRA